MRSRQRRYVPNPYFGTIPRSSSLGDPTNTRAQLTKPYPQYTTVSLYRNNVGTTIYHGAYVKLEQRFSGGLSYLVSYTRSKRCSTRRRNPVRGPGYRNLDLALMRRILLSSARTVEIRAEVFNATNTPPLLAPNAVVGSAAFGTITAAGDPRVVQFAVKFLF